MMGGGELLGQTELEEDDEEDEVTGGELEAEELGEVVGAELEGEELDGGGLDEELAGAELDGELAGAELDDGELG